MPTNDLNDTNLSTLMSRLFSSRKTASFGKKAYSSVSPHASGHDSYQSRPALQVTRKRSLVLQIAAVVFVVGAAGSCWADDQAAQPQASQNSSAVESLIGPMVTIPAGAVKSFKMMKYEVTFDQYDAFTRATRRKLPDDEGWGRGNRPVINVSWEDAQAFAQWVSQQSGARVRLPSEVEWEYAARAGTTTHYWWGDDAGSNRANCDGCGSEWDNKQTAPVGSFDANPWGLHDTAGNVWEWVEDCSSSDCSYRVLRGGSWSFKASDIRSTYRYWSPPDFRYFTYGFRLAQDL